MTHRLAVALLLAATLLLLPTPAEAAACSGTTGVTVVVDYDNGQTRTACAPGDPSSGYAALRAAGFTITGAQGSGAGALCSIDGVPENQCTSMPPADAYWAYFHVKQGAWVYSNTGGGGYDPEPGSVEGWRFRGSPTKPPRVAPPDAPKPTPTARPTAAATSKPTTTPTTGGGADVPRGPAPTGSTSAAAPDASAAATTSSSVGATPTDAPTAGDDQTSAASAGTADAPFRETADDSGGLSWYWGLGLVLVIGTAGGVAAMRRRG